MTFQLPRLYPILDSDALRQRDLSPIAAAEGMLEAGARILQFRHKDPWTEAVYRQAQRIAELARQAQAIFVINDRAEYAALLDTAVHVGQHDLPPAAVRRVVRNAIIGFSTHNREQVLRGEAEDVNYLALGPIFETTSKGNPDPVVGLASLRTLRPLTRKPLVAIGGITQSNALDVLAAGADSLALIGGLLPSGGRQADIRRIASEWLQLVF